MAVADVVKAAIEGAKNDAQAMVDNLPVHPLGVVKVPHELGDRVQKIAGRTIANYSSDLTAAAEAEVKAAVLPWAQTQMAAKDKADAANQKAALAAQKAAAVEAS